MAYLIERVVLFLYLIERVVFRYTLFRKHQFLKEFLLKYFLAACYVSCAWELFSVNLIVFAIYVKDS